MSCYHWLEWQQIIGIDVRRAVLLICMNINFTGQLLYAKSQVKLQHVELLSKSIYYNTVSKTKSKNFKKAINLPSVIHKSKCLEVYLKLIYHFVPLVARLDRYSLNRCKRNKKVKLPMATKTWLNSAKDKRPLDSLSYNLRPSMKSSYVPQDLIIFY
ncbi:hypothetical protein BpHYR1_049490 [Brachionus plicatilis]|uniref:Uncharacterized protein n=1 Tax=Brachionus plicatilis TaxID=10195 RepID=A0A3M7S8B0_BRAPC|nr:hypothetical protein BpHYR1_049490 [Brachionus plicatilis]